MLIYDHIKDVCQMWLEELNMDLDKRLNENCGFFYPLLSDSDQHSSDCWINMHVLLWELLCIGCDYTPVSIYKDLRIFIEKQLW